MSNVAVLLIVASLLVALSAGPLAYVLFGLAAVVELLVVPTFRAAIAKAREEGVQI